jgi:multimeric flavodoxin WrbA/protein-tyrosine-phosphatase
MGSPRKNGNTAFLLNTFLAEAKRHGAETHHIHVPDLSIHPCIGCGLCERKGFCHFDDDMPNLIYPLLRMSDVVIIASPVYFYSVPAELKALIDRTQTLWSRKFKLRLNDPGERSRRGFLLSVGATRGGDLFDGIRLTMKYFLQSIAATNAGDLSYSRIEDLGEMKRHPTVDDDVSRAVSELLAPLERRTPTVLFVCRDNRLFSPMAAAFAAHLAGDRIRVLSAGIRPGTDLHPALVATMAEKSLDLAFRIPQSLAATVASARPDCVVLMGDGEDTAVHIPGARTVNWNLPEPDDALSDQAVTDLRNLIEDKVRALTDDLTKPA